MAAQTKTMSDLPHFHVSKITQSQSNTDYFELAGIFDRTAGVTEGRCSLLLPVGETLTALPAYLESLDEAERTARIHTPSKTHPEVADIVLTYVGPQWDPLHVLMVALPTWKWSRVLFQATDAISEIVKGDSPSIVDGEEIKEWIKISQKGKDAGLSRYYPIFPSGKTNLSRIEPDGVILGGWNYVHCELCHGHIDDGQYGHHDSSEHWVCEACYGKYVANHDLSFMFV